MKRSRRLDKRPEKMMCQVASLQIDTLMKQAKTADSSRFGDKQKLDVHHKAVHTIVLDTGIRRRSDPESLLPEGFEEAVKRCNADQ